jgi:hypothetical protein
MRLSLSWMLGSLVAGLVAAGCSQSTSDGQESLGKTKSLQPSTTSIVASRLTTLEDAIFNETPSGWYGAATSRGHHLFITQSTGAFVGGYGPRAYLLRDNRVVNPDGTELAGKIPPGLPFQNVAVNTGTHWLAFLGTDLSVLDLDGALASTRTLPLSGRGLVWGGDRALLLGAPASATTDVGVQQGQFLDDAGQPLGPVFDIAPGATLMKGGAAFDGSRFVVEYSTQEGVFVVAVSSSGEHGAPVKIATDGNSGSNGLGLSVLSDGQSFLLAYRGSTDDPANSPQGPHYRIATVDSSLTLTVGDQHVAEGLNANVTSTAFFGGRYFFTDYYNFKAISVATDGTPQGSAFSWVPFPTANVTGFAVSADADGSSPVVIDSAGHASRLADDLTRLDDPPLQFGLGPQVLGTSGAAFDGSHFRVEWSDTARASVRTIGVETTGSVLAPGAGALGGANAAASGRWIASNGSSVLRLLASSSAGTLTQSDGSVVSLDLSALGLGTGYDPSIATNGSDYLVASGSTGATLALVSSAGGVTVKSINTVGAPNLAFDGTQWLFASGAYGQLDLTPISADLTSGATQALLTVPGDLGTWLTLASNGAGSFIAWVAHVDGHYQVYGSRVSEGLALLDAPGVLLGNTCSWNPPSATSDGTNYWVAWPDEGTCRPAVRRIGAEPVSGSILLEDSPFVLADPPMGRPSLAARAGGPVLLVENPYYSGPVRERVLTEGNPTFFDVVGSAL